MMRRARTLYVNDEDQRVWEAAKRAAHAAGISLSEYVTRALLASLTDKAPSPLTLARQLVARLEATQTGGR
jgi:hypothetical protein